MNSVPAVMTLGPVIPVVTIDAGVDAVALAQALLRGGIASMEITLRTDAALEAISRVSKEVSEMSVGAGTVWTRQQATAAHQAGADFMVCPGITDTVLDYCIDNRLDLLPGAQTASEVAHWVRRGVSAVKLFPAHYAGGVGALKSLAAVFPELVFCPTGGISAANAGDYLSLKSVACVGGSWLAPAKLQAAGDWSAITELARAASALST